MANQPEKKYMIEMLSIKLKSLEAAKYESPAIW